MNLFKKKISPEEKKSKARIVCSEPTSHRLGDDLVRLYNQQKFSDVTLQVQKRTFYAHKFILGARSSVFSAMFENDLNEKRSSVVNISDIDPDTVDMMLTFMYSDTLDIYSDTLDMQVKSAIAVYSAAFKYDIALLKDYCRSYLKSNLDVSNVIDVFVLTDTYPDLELRNSAQEFAVKHTTEIFRSKEWENFVISHSHLAAEIMHNMFVGKNMKVVKGMTIYVRTLKGKIFPLQVHASDTVENLKREIQDKEGAPISEQRLLFAGKQLENDRTVSQCNIREGSIVELVLRLIG